MRPVIIDDCPGHIPDGTYPCSCSKFQDITGSDHVYFFIFLFFFLRLLFFYFDKTFLAEGVSKYIFIYSVHRHGECSCHLYCFCHTLPTPLSLKLDAQDILMFRYLQLLIDY